MGYWLKNNEDYAVEDIGTTQSKWRAMYRDANGDERLIIKTFSFKEDALRAIGNNRKPCNK